MEVVMKKKNVILLATSILLGTMACDEPHVLNTPEFYWVLWLVMSLMF